MITLESILEKDNLNKAFRQVVSNKGTAGIDDMTVDELEPLDKVTSSRANKSHPKWKIQTASCNASVYS